MNVDFCFLDADERLVVTGWSYERDLGLELHGDGGAVQPLQVTRHARQDLRSSEPLGWIAIFRLPLSADQDAEPGAMFLKLGTDFREISAVQLFEDEERLVDIGVDEVFFGYMDLIARQAISCPSGKVVQTMCMRMRSRLEPPGEKMDLALSVDRCLVAPDGQGVLLGWYLPATAQPGIVALATDGEQVVPVMLLSSSLPRQDLQPYAGRYRFTGHDGFCGAFSFGAPVTDPVQVVLMPQLADTTLAIGATAETVPPVLVARAAVEMSLGLGDAESRRRLRAALLPPAREVDGRELERALQARAEPDGPTLAVLDHDLPDADLRDVLRRLLSLCPGVVAVQILRQTISPVLAQAALGAAHEAGEDRLLPLTAGLSVVARPAREVIFARSSALFQIGLPEVSPTAPGALAVVDAIGALTGADGADLLGRFDRDLLPFVARVDGQVFFRLLDFAPHGCLTEEARVRGLLLLMGERGALTLGRADLPRYFAGKGGPYAETFPDGGDWHAYDAERKKLMTAGPAQ